MTRASAVPASVWSRSSGYIAEAHLNIIRNWLGQNTEEVFYDLADEYGLLVLNDFWESTQDFQVEAEDPQLFLANARDVIRRFRQSPLDCRLVRPQ